MKLLLLVAFIHIAMVNSILRISFFSMKSSEINKSKDDIECSDGICKIRDQTHAINDTTSVTNPINSSDTSLNQKLIDTTVDTTVESDNNSIIENIAPNVAEIVKLGYSKDDAIRALNITSDSVEEAIDLLATEEEQIKAGVDELYNKHYWNKEISDYALRTTLPSINITKGIDK